MIRAGSPSNPFASVLPLALALALLAPAFLLADTNPPPPSAASITGVVHVDDCNDTDSPLPTWVCREAPHSLLPPDYPYYVGHDEPEMEFFSTKPGSGNNLQWKIKLPAADPVPQQDGSVVANRELFSTIWFSLALCDPQSTPFGACTPNSDSNTSSAGSAILELQFYPPGSNCPGDDSKWCASLTIDELTTNCGEPITAAPITTNGSPGGPRLLMSPSDSILITIKDSVAGLETDVNDLTSAATGSMVASAANGFTQTVESTHATDPSATCPTSPFSYHPEYLTASPANTGSWINANVNLSYEIGHWELCGDAGCSTKPDSDADDTGCGTALGVGGCTGKDGDYDGTSYVADWPDGTASHPGSLIIENALDDGMGPLSFSNGSYQAAYGSIFFQPATTNLGAFYPFFSQAGTGHSCVFNFGDDIPGTTSNDFGKTAQYGTTITNPCTGAPIAVCQDASVPTDPDVCTAAVASIDHGSFDTDGDALTFSQSPGSPYSLGTASVTLTVEDSESLSDSCSASVTVNDLQKPAISCPSPVVECTGPGGASVTLSPAVSDNCPGVGVGACVPASGSTFPLGTTSFSCDVTDASANSNACNSTVKVQDTTPPVISCNAPASIKPANAPISFTATASDVCDTSPAVSITGFSCFTFNGAGKRTDKAESCVVQIQGSTLTILNSGGFGDNIRWTVSAVDASGNTSTGTCTLSVTKS
jgi:HYR domain-containing protein